MENINKYNSSITEDNSKRKYDEYNKVEWINYFNEGLIVESINNQINNTTNRNKQIQNNNKQKYSNNNTNINIIKNKTILNSNKKTKANNSIN